MIVIIGILATLAIVAYTGIQLRAYRGALRSDLSQAVSQLQNYKTLNNSSYPSSLSLLNDGTGAKSSPGTTYEYTQSGSNVCITATSSFAQTSYYYDSTTNTITDGACTGHVGYTSGGPAAADYLASSAYNNCRVSGGKAYCWGPNNYNQLGDGTTTTATTPIQAATANSLLTGKTVIAAEVNSFHGCALVSTGQVYCWGYGYLGDSTIHGSGYPPVAVTTSGALSGKTVTKLTVGDQKTCVIADGAAYCWGSSYNGNGVSTYSFAPVAVDTSGVLGGKTVTAITIGDGHTCAIADGGAYCWGGNTYGQLGDNSTATATSPVAVDTSGVLAGKTLVDIAAGGSGYYETTCAIDSAGAAYCWGYGQYGGLGNNTATVTQTTPVAVTTTGVLSGKTLVDVAVSYGAACAIDSAGAAYCWGRNQSGQLGNGTTTPLTTNNPVAVVSSGVLNGVVLESIDMGHYHTCAMGSTNTMYCWGRGVSGELGDGLSTSSSVPVIVSPHP